MQVIKTFDEIPADDYTNWYKLNWTNTFVCRTFLPGLKDAQDVLLDVDSVFSAGAWNPASSLWNPINFNNLDGLGRGYPRNFTGVGSDDWQNCTTDEADITLKVETNPNGTLPVGTYTNATHAGIFITGSSTNTGRFALDPLIAGTLGAEWTGVITWSNVDLHGPNGGAYAITPMFRYSEIPAKFTEGTFFYNCKRGNCGAAASSNYGATTRWHIYDKEDKLLMGELYGEVTSDIALYQQQQVAVMDMDASNSSMVIGSAYNILPAADGIKWAFLCKSNSNKSTTDSSMFCAFVKSYQI
tara:strand:+ start:566 stop:1462 length:897 start_codon:yes stop_codon:yes gene_type:complete